MIKGKWVLALIPARGGSKGIPHKNIIDFHGKPLIAYTIEAAKQCEAVDDIVVTTDDEEIRRVAVQYGAEAPFLRPAEYAADTSKTIDAVLHALRWLTEHGRTWDILVLLQPTSPLRTSEDISRGIALFMEKGDSVCSVSPVDKHPAFIRSIEQDGRCVSLIPGMMTARRQDLKEFYQVDGAVYINTVSELNEDTNFNENRYGLVMEKSHSVDIDEKSDICMADYFYGEKCK